jgi:transcriptional regulator with XRE-family HTH domain
MTPTRLEQSPEITEALEIIFASDMTWDELEGHFGVSRGTLSNWKNGREPRYAEGQQILALASLLKRGKK